MHRLWSGLLVSLCVHVATHVVIRHVLVPLQVSCPPGHFYYGPTDRGVTDWRWWLNRVDVGNECVACPYQTYKTGHGNDVTCTPCRGTVTNTSRTGAVAESECLCVPGRYFDNDLGVCILCDWGTFKSQLGNGKCTECPRDAGTLNAGSTSSRQCLCYAGHEPHPSTGACVPCRHGTYKSALSSDACTPCGPNSNTTSTGSEYGDECLCLPGYTYFYTARRCMACPYGTYKPHLGGDHCLACPRGRATRVTAAVLSKQCVRLR